jgi:SagB-type dehydrogenase family enzyme
MSNNNTWDKIRLSSSNADQDDVSWEFFHENSKLSEFSTIALSDQEIVATMRDNYESLEFKGYTEIKLPRSPTPLKSPLEKVISTRISSRDLIRTSMTLQDVATILYYAYGVTRDNKNTSYPRPFRIVPSGGALYPLELFFHSADISEQVPGIYHYNPITNSIRLLQEGDQSSRISESFVQKEIAYGASLIIFITAMFDRCIFKYQDRGYRFVLLEAGHVAQNINLVVNALGRGCVNLGGFFDRKVDSLLGLDGLTHSTIYIVAIGGKKQIE